MEMQKLVSRGSSPLGCFQQQTFHMWRWAQGVIPTVGFDWEESLFAKYAKGIEEIGQSGLELNIILEY